jgi:UDP-N-acetylmuramoylalanine-D-glutamate ligase
MILSSKSERKKIAVAMELLRQNGITKESLAKTLRSFKEQYPRMNKYAVVSYIDDAFKEMYYKARETFHAV